MATSTTEPSAERVSYCEGWHRYFKEIIHPLSPEEAKRLDQAREPYAVIVGDPSHPYCFIEVSEGCFGVSFLDENKREYLSYTFEEVGSDKVFLKEASSREYQGASDEVARGKVYRFSTGGAVSIERSEKPFRQASITESRSDVAKNWEPKPAFGEYARLLVKDR